MLFAYFDESMASIGGYEPYRSWNKVGLTQIWIKNEFITVPWSGGLFYFANGAHEIFCWDLCCEVFMFLGKDLMVYGVRSGKSLSLGMTKAPLGKIQGQPKS